MDPYSIIAQMPNAGAAFSDAFNHGMQQNALSSFAMNPNDPRNQGMAARYDPGAVMQFKQGQQQAQLQAQKEQHEEWLKYAGSLAKWADTPEKWDQAVDYIVQSGHPEAAQLKGHFSPALRANFMAQAGIQDDRPQNPQMIPYQAGGGVLMRDPTTGQVQNLVIPNDGSHAPGSQVASAPPAEAVARLKANPQEAAQFDEIFGAGASQQVLGGQTVPAPSVGFP